MILGKIEKIVKKTFFPKNDAVIARVGNCRSGILSILEFYTICMNLSHIPRSIFGKSQKT